jgi:hypothetical protein
MLRLLTGFGVAASLLLAPTAAAKFGIKLDMSVKTPRVGQPVVLVLRTDRALDADVNLRLQARSPRLSVTDVKLVRTAPDAWRGRFRFKSAGTWQLIVPNWGAPGGAWPLPLSQRVKVLPKRD